LAEDVLAGVEYLKSREQINPKQIGLIGHSEGGIIAPVVATRLSDIAFIVLMAGTGVNGQKILYLQSELLLKAIGASDKALAVQRASLDQIFKILKDQKDDTIAKEKIREALTETLSKLGKEEKDSLGMSEAAIEIQLQMILSRWFRFFIAYDPKLILMKVRCPVLAINGELDLQVPPKENLSVIEAALKAGGNKNYTIRELPKLNHLFQSAQTGSLLEYAKIEETISPIALETITRWILTQTGQNKM
jgi:pimeloyl-ACP methyl ester carboxylesterase